MKKIYLHGALGKRFGKEWSLDVNSASEAISALFANKPDIAKYINKKYQEGVSYGIKKGSNKNFLQKEDYALNTNKDLHLFPVPEGGSAFAINLVVMAATTAASMYIQKKMAEAMKRDDSTLAAQTQSFIYSGSENRFQQGSNIPVGYGRMKIGSNVISSCIVNYDFNSNKQKIFKFENGVPGLVPAYHKYYDNSLGPLGSSFDSNIFEGKSAFKNASPKTKYIKSLEFLSQLGSNDGVYGSYPPSQQAETDKWVGNVFGGYYSYKANFAKGIDKTKLPNFKEGQWFPDPLGSNIQGFPYGLTEDSANKSSYVCTQSVPIRDGQSEERIFYPIIFSEETIKDLKNGSYAGAPFPIQVGERWIGGSKANGVGWFKLESTSIYKAIDLISEGPIEGFCNKNGTSFNFDKEFKLNPNPSLNDPDFLRNEKDDYLQGVFLDDLQVKEVNYSAVEDSYNISEFDIDLGMDSKGIIGGESQGLLDDQYLLTANTKEINSPLYGPRAISYANVSLSSVETKDFVKNKAYSNNVRVAYSQNGEEYTYVVKKSLSDKLEQNNEYKAAGGDIYYLGEENQAEFYTPLEGFNNFEIFSGEGANYIEGGQSEYYEPGDLIKGRTFGGDTRYYEMGNNADKFLGVFDPSKTYTNQVGKILMLDQSSNADINTISQIVKITANYAPGDTISSFTEALTAEYEDEKGEVHTVVNDPWFVATYTQTQGVPKNVFGAEIDITPGSPKSQELNLWEKIIINDPKNITNENGEDRKNLNLFQKLEKGIKANEIDPAEENFISHKIINLNVEEVFISIQIDELSYIYEGDFLEAEYKLGEMMGAIMGGLVGLGIAGSVQNPFDSISGAAFMGLSAALGAIVGLVGSSAAKFSIGTKMENSGEIWPNRAKFRIKYGNEGEALYSTDIYIYGIAISAYRKDIKVYLPKNPHQKDREIKIYKLNRERNFVKEGEQSARYKERFSLASITEVSHVNLSYPNSVIIGTRINARDYSKMPTRTFNLKLKKVAIPSNYDPVTRKYSGNWNGLFKGQKNKNDSIPESALHWTDNPAWCLYDLISNKRYGIGKFGIKPEHVDRWTLYRIAKYCDDYVPTGYSSKYTKRSFNVNGSKAIKIDGGANYDSVDFSGEFNYPRKKIAIFYEDNTYESITIDNVDSSEKIVYLENDPVQKSGACAVSIDYPIVEPRYTMNALIMDQQNAFKLINEFASIFRAFAYWSGGAINFFQDEKRDSVMLFTNNNISDQGFSYSSTPKTSRTNACKIKYLDRYNMYRPKIEYSEDKEAIKDNNIIEQTVDGFGITSQAQAKRAADFVVKTANSETELISFDTSSIGSYLKPGDIVEVLDQKRNLGKFSGKVLNIRIADDGKYAEIDIDYPIRTIIDPLNKDTWKKITLYLPKQNQSIASLDEAAQVNDQDILNIRATQIAEYLISDITENDTRLILTNNTYSYVEGEFKWEKAIRDAENRGGVLATIQSEQDQKFANFVLPTDKKAWVAGFKNDSGEYAWFNSEACEDGGSALTYQNWASGQPDITENYIYIQGETDESHGQWLTDQYADLKGYILDKPSDSPLVDLRDSEGVSFVMEDDVHFANKKKYKILSIEESGQGTFKVQGLEYDEEKFDNIEKDISIKAPESPVIFTEQPLDAPSNVTLQILSEDVDQEVSYGLRAMWNEVAGAVSYRVQFFSGNVLLASFEIPSKNQWSMEYDFRDPRITENGSYYARIYTRGR
jgi:predicted phage tail protein